MWPMLLNMTRDECRRTLRRLELEAYSNMISVFRAQGPLEEKRKKLLEELRAVLHISHDRHSAEARRVSNDELLATIAEQLAGPNTGLAWICEGRRRVPLLPRGIAQTMYTEMADKAAEVTIEKNKELQKNLEAEKLVAPKSNEEELADAEGQTAESAIPSNDTMDEILFPPIAMEDQTTKIWETELSGRKRKNPESGAIPDDGTTPVKNMRNIPVNTNQKHLNLSQIYSKFSQPATSKPSGQSKHSYNQVSKVSTSKTIQTNTSRPTPHKHRAHKQSAKNASHKVHAKKQELPVSPSKQYNPTSLQVEYSGPPNTFQATYAQSILGNKNKTDYMDEIKPKVLSSPGMVTDSPTMQLLTQPATVPHELAVPENAHPDDPSTLQAQATPTPKTMSGKPCHLIIKKRGEVTTDKKLQMSELKILQKPAEGLKLLSNRQVVVATSSAQKALSTSGKLVTTKVIGSIPRSRTSTASTPVFTDKMIVVSKPSPETKITSSKIILTSGVNTPAKEGTPISSNNMSPKCTETLTPKGIPATDLKVSAKTVVLNPRSGQKMLVLPAKARTKPGTEGQMPLLHFKGISTAMKLVPVSSQCITQVTKSTAVTVVSKPTVVSAMSSNTKILGMEPIKTANLADIVPAKGMTPVTTPKLTNPIVRPTSSKGVIVVQKGAAIGKALTFTKNGNDMSKIIMGKNVNQLLQASKSEQAEAAKCAGNVIVLELNNEQTGRATTMSEILDSRGSNVARAPDESKKIATITQDTPVLFENQLHDDTCNPSSLDSTTESIGGIVPIEETGLPLIEKDEEAKSSYTKTSEGGKDSSSVTDWEMELDTVSRKQKDDDDKLNSLHLDLGMSSDSENDYMVDSHKHKSKHSTQDSMQRATPSGESSEIYSSSSGLSLATRTLLSQLQDDGSSSNDSSFALKSKPIEKMKEVDSKIDKSESDALTKAKEKLSEKVAEAKSQQKRIDIYSTAISTSDINLESFSYLDEGMMAGDDVFASEESKARESRRPDHLDDQLSTLLGEDSANSTDSQTVSESLPLSK
ncbi:BRCA2-interacting transcriptional repressor EMSY [Galleria mellonella]|uniref:BRCA2-interacting transcriptional repressor EMSY n=1 Tax=Galleria mellonella TaxID=7137 RepID=A0A6J1WX47_GALME|nr:BRCA2-interacting transcriptional repressor EMSY [Galleria mellonella]